MSDNAVCGGAVSGDAVMNESLSLTHCDAIKLADIPDLSRLSSCIAILRLLAPLTMLFMGIVLLLQLFLGRLRITAICY